MDGSEERPDGISRRQALKRIAAAGAVAWAVPTVQTINMSRAFAATSPQQVCYRIKVEEGGSCQTGIGANDCLDPSSFEGNLLNTTGGCSHFVSLVESSDHEWVVTVDQGCEVIGATVKAGTTCYGEDHTGVNITFDGNVVTIALIDTDIKEVISHVEVAFCCPES